MTNDNTTRDTDRAWELMKKIGFAMLVTRDGDKLRARPMSAYLERESNAIYFLTDARRHKDDEIARDPEHQPVVRRCRRPEIRLGHRHGRGLQRPRQDQAAVLDAGESVVGLGRGSEHPRAEDHARRRRVLGFAGHRHQLCEDGGRCRHRHASRPRRQSQGGDVDADRSARNSADRRRDSPTEPPQESPPGNPRPEVPPPMQEPGEPPRPEELPGKHAGRIAGARARRTAHASPATDTGISDLHAQCAGSKSGIPDMPRGTM